MKNYKTQAVVALGLMLGIGSSLVLAQSSAPTTPTPTGAPPSGTSLVPGRRGMGARSGQPRMELALISLQEARRALNDAAHDKGGYREQAIKSVEKAIEDVQAGIEYARAHPEEFPGERGARGPHATSSTTTTTTTGASGG